jgi:hypothetical protein
MALDNLGDMLSALKAQMKEEARAEEEDPELQMAPEAKIVERFHPIHPQPYTLIP